MRPWLWFTIYKGFVVCLNSGMRFYLFYFDLTFLIYFIVPLILTCFLFTISQSSIASHVQSFLFLVTLSLLFSLTCSLSFFFLGRMSALAANQEKQDIDLLLSNRQRIQAMPFYWLEMLEIETVARSGWLHHYSSSEWINVIRH